MIHYTASGETKVINGKLNIIEEMTDGEGKKSLNINGNLNIQGILSAHEYANFPVDPKLDKFNIIEDQDDKNVINKTMIKIGEDLTGSSSMGIYKGDAQFEAIRIDGKEPKFNFVTSKKKDDKKGYKYTNLATLTGNKMILGNKEKSGQLCLGETCLNEEQLKKILEKKK